MDVRIFIFITMLGSISFACSVPDLPISDDHSVVVSVNLSDRDIISPITKNYFDTCRLIPLETNMNCMIGEISRVKIHRNYLYILDSRYTQELYIFDLNGKMVNKISRKGNGPQEYINIRDFYVDTIRSTLNLVCNANRKVMSFTLTGDSLLKEQRLPLRIVSADVDKTGTIIGYAGNISSSQRFSSRIYILSADDYSVKGNAFPIDKQWESRHVGTTNRLFSYNGNIQYFPSLEYSVFQINADTILLRYRYDLGSHELPDIYKKPDYFLTEKKQTLPKNIVIQLDAVQETDQFLAAYFVFNHLPRINFYSKQTGKNRTYDLQSNPFLDRVLPFGNIEAMNNDYMITSIQPEVFKMILKHPEMIKHFSQTIELIKQVKLDRLADDANPVVCLYKWKQ